MFLLMAYILKVVVVSRFFWIFLNKIKTKPNNVTFFVIVSSVSEFIEYETSHIRIVGKSVPSIGILSPFINKFILPRIIVKYDIDVVMNFGNVPISTQKKQIYLYQWSYLLSDHPMIWSRMNNKEYFTRALKKRCIEKRMKYVDHTIAQTSLIAMELREKFNIGKENISVIPPVCSSILKFNASSGEKFILPKGKLLIYITRYYSHKNIEILLPLARLIKKHRKDYRLLVTLDVKEHPRAKKFLEMVEKDKLAEIIFNIGPVDRKNIPYLYKSCSALIMPTLLETFGIPYVESFYFNKPIFTSNLDFVRSVCGEGAFYFDPCDANDIFRCIDEVFFR